jgi:hypothetical protein
LFILLANENWDFQKSAILMNLFRLGHEITQGAPCEGEKWPACSVRQVREGIVRIVRSALQ